MAFSAADVAALEAALATGALRVKLGDMETTYQSAADMLRVLEAARADVAASAATPPQRMVRVVHVRV